MNSLGKIFIGLICAMSLVFMTFTIMVYSTQQNWKTKHDEVKKELADAQTRVKDLTDRQTTLEATSNAALAEKEENIRKLNAQIAVFERLKQKDQDDISKLQSDKALALDTIKESHDSIQVAQRHQVALRENFNKAQQDWNNLLDDYVVKTDEAHDLQMKLTNLEEVGRDLVKQYNSASTVLKQFGLKPLPEIYSGVPLHRVDGRVVDVRPNGTVEITIGEDSGIMKGHQLDVYRRADGKDIYIGVAEVVFTEPNRAACNILPQYRKGTVQVNDIVTSEYSQDRQKYQVKGGQEHVATKR